MDNDVIHFRTRFECFLLFFVLITRVLFAGEPGQPDALSPNLMPCTTFNRCTNPGIPDGWEALDGRYHSPVSSVLSNWGPDSLRAEDGSPIPGTRCMRIDGDFYLSEYVGLNEKNNEVVFSSYIRAHKENVPVNMFIGRKMKLIHVSKEWKRYSFLATPELLNWPKNSCAFGWQGSSNAVIWVAAPQLEYAPHDENAKRADRWIRSLEKDYEVDEAIAHSGKQSIRLSNAAFPSYLPRGAKAQSGAEQKGEFDKEDFRPLVVAGWCKTRDVTRQPQIEIEIFRDKKYWKPKSPWAKEPSEQFVLAFNTGTHDWEFNKMTITPKWSVKRYVVRPVLSEENDKNGIAWFDDLILYPKGEKISDPAVKEPEALLEDNSDILMDDTQLSDVIEVAETMNILINPGFEELGTNRIVTRFCNRPSAYRPSNYPSYVDENDEQQQRYVDAPPSPEARCAYVESQPVIDGRLEDSCWAKATRITSFRNIKTGEPAPFPTTAFVCRDKSRLYVGFKADRATVAEMKKTTNGMPEVGVLIKPELTGRHHFDFHITRTGEKGEMKVYAGVYGIQDKGWPTGHHPEWEKPWTGATAGGESATEDWTAEFAIPISSLEVYYDTDFWGFNLYRKTEDGTIWAWSPSYRDLHPGRLNITRFYFGRLHNMSGCVADKPYEGLYRITDLGLESLPDGKLGAIAEVERELPVSWEELESDLTIEFDPPTAKGKKAQKETPRNPHKKTVRLSLSGESLIARIAGFDLPGTNRIYRVKAGLSTRLRRRPTLRSELSESDASDRSRLRQPCGIAWRRGESGDYGVAKARVGEDEKVLAERSEVIHTSGSYNAALARFRIRTELSYYMQEKEARLLVESALEEPVSLRFTAWLDQEFRAEELQGAIEKPDLEAQMDANVQGPGDDLELDEQALDQDASLMKPEDRSFPLSVIGEDSISAGDKRYIAVDIDELPVGYYTLKGECVDADGKVKALAYDTLIKLPPAEYGTRLNRVTGCFLIDGKWRMLRVGPRVRSEKIIAEKDMAFNAVRIGAGGLNKELLDSLLAKNLHVISGMGSGWWGMPKVNIIMKGIGLLTRHPAILYWELADEPFGSSKPVLDAYQVAKKRDPYRPAAINWGGWHPGTGGAGTLDATDVAHSDVYPFGISGKWMVMWDYPINHMTHYYLAMWDDGREHGKPIGFWHGIYGGGDGYREPTPAEMRCMLYLGMIYGQRSFAYFRGTPMYVPLWEMIGQVQNEMQGLEAFLADDALPVFVGLHDGLHWALWKNQRGLLLLACNSLPFTQPGCLSVEALNKGAVKKIQVLVGRPECASLRAGSIFLDLKPYEPVTLFIKNQIAEQILQGKQR